MKVFSRMFLGLVVGLSLSVTAVASDSSGGYIGAGASIWIFDVDGLDDNFSGTAATFKGGYRINENVAIEGRYTAGGDDDMGGVTFDLDSVLTGLIKAGGSVGDNTRLDVSIGFSRTEASVSGFGIYAEDTETDLSLGLGMETELNDRIGLGVDYTIYNLGDDYTLHGPSIGLLVYF